MDIFSRRSIRQPHYAILCPENHMPGQIPGWHDSSLTVTASPELGAQFCQYLATMPPGGRARAAAAGLERFVYVLSGKVTLQYEGKESTLAQDSYAYLPATKKAEEGQAQLLSNTGAQLCIFEQHYRASHQTEAPQLVQGHADGVARYAFKGSHVQAQALLPTGLEYDMSVFILSAEPGAMLPLVEMHQAEHGGQVLAGRAIFRFNQQDWQPLHAGDSMWIAPYCPHWFAALGDAPFRYLLYRNGNRHPLTTPQG